MTKPAFDLGLLLASPLFEGASLLLGLLVGSFANVCVHRLPLGLSVVTPPSRCPKCRSPIAPYDNVPVLGWLWLRGRCRSCLCPISVRYPAIELLNGLLFLAIAMLCGPSLDALVRMCFATTLLVLGLVDLDHQILPDVITLPGILLGLTLGVADVWGPGHLRWLAAAGGLASMAVVGLLLGFDTRRADEDRGPDGKGMAMVAAFAAWHRFVLGAWSGPALAALSGYLLFALVAAAARRYYGQEALGEGDWKMVALLGAVLGGRGMMVSVLLGTLGGATSGLALIAAGRLERRSKIPLGTFLAAGGIGALLAGEPLLRWYEGLFRG